MVKTLNAPRTGDTSFQPRASASERESGEWRKVVPVLTGARVRLREVQVSDAPALFAAVTSEHVSRFLSPPPSTVDAFEHFIVSARRRREQGEYICLAVVPHGSEMPIGMFQIRALDPTFGAAEWGFALDSAFWGTGVFVDAARLVVDFTFAILGSQRLEARAAVRNGRGNGALRKLGAVQEGLLRRGLTKNGESHDQMLWTILREEWVEGTPQKNAPLILH